MSELPSHGTFCWNELMTRNTAAAESFYSKLLGWTTAASGMPGITYTLWKNNGKDAGGMMAMPEDVPAEVPAHWLAYIAVDDVDATAAKVTELGGQVMHGPIDVPHVGRFVVIQDPTGATLGLITLNPPAK